jgi:hypothetical protein
MNAIAFHVDWSDKAAKWFLVGFRYVLLFVAFVILLAEIETGFDISGSYLAIIIAIGIVFSSFIGLWVFLFGVRAIVFDDAGIDLVPFVNLGFGRNRFRTIAYKNCRVVETTYWKFKDHYFLKFYDGHKCVEVLGKSEWNKTYEDIRRQVMVRLKGSQLNLKGTSTMTGAAP